MSVCGQSKDSVREWLKKALGQVSSASFKQEWKYKPKAALKAYKRFLVNGLYRLKS